MRWHKLTYGRVSSESRYALIKAVGSDVHSTRQFPLHFPFRASPCAITVQLHSTVAKCITTFRTHCLLSPQHYSRTVIQCEWIIPEYRKKDWILNYMEEACGKTTTQTVRPNRHALLAAAQYKIRGWRRLESDRDILRRTAEQSGARCGLSRQRKTRSSGFFTVGKVAGALKQPLAFNCCLG